MSFILALICAFCAFIYLGLCGFFFVTQRSFIYFPCQKQNYTVDQIQVNTGQALVQLSASNLKSKRAILYFGGNAEDVSVSLPEYRHGFFLGAYRWPMRRAIPTNTTAT